MSLPNVWKTEQGKTWRPTRTQKSGYLKVPNAKSVTLQKTVSTHESGSVALTKDELKMNKPYSPKQSERVSEQLNVRDLFRTKQIAFSEIDPRRNLETSYCSVVCLMPLCQLHFRHLLLLATGHQKLLEYRATQRSVSSAYQPISTESSQFHLVKSELT